MNRTPLFPRTAAVVLAVLSARGAALAAEEPADVDWQPYFHALAKSYTMTPASGPDHRLSLNETPVLRWTQPVRGGDDGAVYVWLDEGRPAVIGTMFCWPHRDGYRVVVNEFHSLMTGPLVALRGGTPAWSPQEGITWRPLADAPAPASSAPRRLVQMRQLAGRFRGENIDDSSGQKWELRLLRQPLFRYELPEEQPASPREVLDGTLFTLATGTDPEILLLIEATGGDGGPRWQYALARFSDRPLTVWLDEEHIWSVDRARPTRNTAHTFFDVARLTRPPEEATQ